MRKILLSIIALCISGATFASRPLKGFRTHVQSDGKTINIQPTGNSISGFYVTNDDFALYSVDGDFFYAYLDAEGNFKNSGILAHNKEERTEAENELLKGSEYQNVASRFEYEPETYCLPNNGKTTRDVGTRELSTVTCNGEQNFLVMLVDFSDVQFKTEEISNTNPVAYYDLEFNGEDAKQVFDITKNSASIRQYFIDQSSGLFKPSFDVYNKIYRAKQPSTYYGQDSGGSKDVNIRRLRDEIANYLKNENIDLAKYDSDKDGQIDCLIVVFAGQSQGIPGGQSNNIWNKCIPGRSNFSTCGIYNIGTTVFSSERYTNSDVTYIEGMGTLCHEFSHALGLPDMYWTKNTKYFGLDVWSLMDCGCNLTNSSEIVGTKPVGYTAYEKAFMGWTELEELKEGYQEFKNLRSIANGGKAYKITNPNNSNEYLIIENRQKDNWALIRSGLQIMKVNYIYDKWVKNIVNSYEDQLCTLIPADGELTLPDDENYEVGLYGDLFPIDDALIANHGQYGLNTKVTEFVPTDESLFYYKFPIRNITRDTNAFTVSFTIGNNPTGVDAANAAALVDVYDVNGIRLRKDVEAGTATDNLPEGIYIVGGKKVIKR